MVVNELITAFSFKGNINPLKDFNKELGGLIPKTTKWSVGLSGLGALFTKMASNSLKSNNALVQFSHLTNESISNIQGLELAGAKFGSSLGDGIKSIQNLSKGLAEARLVGNKTFGKLGISIVNANNELKTSSEILSDMNKLFNSQNRIYGKGADKRLKLQALQSAGISGSLLPLLMKSTDEYKKQIKASKQLSLSGDQSENIRVFNNVLNETSQIFGLITSQISAELAPAFTYILETAKEFVTNNKEIIVTIGKWVAIIGLVVGTFSFVLLAVKAILLPLKIIRTVMIGISIASLPITGTFVLIAAAVAAIGAAIYIFRDELAKAWEWVSKIDDAFTNWSFDKIKGIGEWFNNLFTSIQTWWDELDFSISMPSWLGGDWFGGNENENENGNKRTSENSTRVKKNNKRTINPDYYKSQIDYYKSQRLSPVSSFGTKQNTTQNNNIIVNTNEPKVMQKVIEDTLNKGIKLIQEISTRGGI